MEEEALSLSLSLSPPPLSLSPSLSLSLSLVSRFSVPSLSLVFAKNVPGGLKARVCVHCKGIGIEFPPL